MKKSPPSASSIRDRRRTPGQSRARATAHAIREAFVRLLVEKSYDQVTIRDVITLAGVGTGSFYEYFSSKDALAAVCIHLRVKEIAAAMRNSIEANRAQPLPARVDALLQAECAAPLAEPRLWAALFVLEREVSNIKAYRRHYSELLHLWEEALSAGADWPAGVARGEAAFAAHAIVYSLVSQSLIISVRRLEPDAMLRMLRTAVHGYLSRIASLAYREYDFHNSILYAIH
jgi:AcrR family transcriptional regulator